MHTMISMEHRHGNLNRIGDSLNRMRRAAGVAAVVFIGTVIGRPTHAQTPTDSAVARPDSAAPVTDTLLRRDTSIASSRAGMAQDCYLNGCTPPRPAEACGIPRKELTLRRAGVATAFVGGNAILYSYFKRAWWSGERADHFYFHSDWDQDFRDQDKFGHALGGYQLARFGNAFLRSTCMSKTKAI